jgi:hypothetical protein
LARHARKVEIEVMTLGERHALDAAALYGRGLDNEFEIRDLGVRCEPRADGRFHATLLLCVDHLERVPERKAAFLFDFHHDEATATPENEVELVAAGACVRFEESVAAKTVVPESAALAAIHAAS